MAIKALWVSTLGRGGGGPSVETAVVSAFGRKKVSRVRTSGHARDRVNVWIGIVDC